MNLLQFDDVVPEILKTVTGLRFPPDFDDYELQYVVVENYLIDHLISEDASPGDVDAGFALMMRMAESDDETVQGLLDVGVIEWFEVWSRSEERRQQIARFLSQTPDTLDAALHREFPERWPQLRADLGLDASE